MNRMWCNNAIICTVLQINRRYFSSKKDSVEIFNAYMQEVILKFYNFSFILLTFLFWAWCMHRKFSALRFVELCLGMVVSEISSCFTHTLYFLNTLLTTFLFTQPSHSTPLWSENDYVCWVLLQYTNMRYCFQYVFHDGESRISA